jgi:hypothetical protein
MSNTRKTRWWLIVAVATATLKFEVRTLPVLYPVNPEIGVKGGAYVTLVGYIPEYIFHTPVRKVLYIGNTLCSMDTNFGRILQVEFMVVPRYLVPSLGLVIRIARAF